MSKSFRENSRDEWHSASEHPTEGQIRVGCLQRIANSLEHVAHQLAQINNRFDCGTTMEVASALISLKKPKRRRRR